MKKKQQREKKFRTYRHDVVACPLCGYKMDGSTDLAVDQRPPRAGDFTVCLRCGEILRWGSDAELVPAVGFEIYDDLSAPQRMQLLRAQRIIRQQRFIQRAEQQS